MDPGPIRSIPNHDKATTAICREALHHDVSPLVWDKPARQQEKVILVMPAPKAVHINRGMDDDRVPPISLLDAARDVVGVGNKKIDVVRAAYVPLAQSCQQPSGID